MQKLVGGTRSLEAKEWVPPIPFRESPLERHGESGGGSFPSQSVKNRFLSEYSIQPEKDGNGTFNIHLFSRSSYVILQIMILRIFGGNSHGHPCGADGTEEKDDL